jgi:hypothetical protein
LFRLCAKTLWSDFNKGRIIFNLSEIHCFPIYFGTIAES